MGVDQNLRRFNLRMLTSPLLEHLLRGVRCRRRYPDTQVLLCLQSAQSLRGQCSNDLGLAEAGCDALENRNSQPDDPLLGSLEEFVRLPLRIQQMLCHEGLGLRQPLRVALDTGLLYHLISPALSSPDDVACLEQQT